MGSRLASIQERSFDEIAGRHSARCAVFDRTRARIPASGSSHRIATSADVSTIIAATRVRHTAGRHDRRKRNGSLRRAAQSFPIIRRRSARLQFLLPADALQPLTHRDRNGGRHALPGQFGQFLYQSVRFLVLVADCSSQSICTRQKLAAFALNLRCRLTRTTYGLHIFGAKWSATSRLKSCWAFHLMSVIRSGWPKPSLSVSSAFPAMLQIGGIYCCLFDFGPRTRL